MPCLPKGRCPLAERRILLGECTSADALVTQLSLQLHVTYLTLCDLHRLLHFVRRIQNEAAQIVVNQHHLEDLLGCNKDFEKEI